MAPVAPSERESRARRSSSWRLWLLGRPLPTADAPHQAIGKAVGLAVFASDALSSTAYATQEILVDPGGRGDRRLRLRLPDRGGDRPCCWRIVTISYEQTIHAYPGGGGAYIVARDNLGELPAQIAGAALLTDYILTVAVSVSSGVAAARLGVPRDLDHRAASRRCCVSFVMVINLRGVKERARSSRSRPSSSS